MQKRRENSGERYKRVIRQRRIFVLSVFVIVVVLCICLFTPIFGISDISVYGNTVVSSEDIIAASGIEKGENVFRINKSKAEEALSSIAYIEGAQIKRKFPARIEIEIDEAKPDIIVDTPTQFIVTNINGRVLEITDDVTHLTSPIVYGIEVTGAEPAKEIQTADTESFATDIAYIGCFYQTEHWPNIDEFYVSDITNFVMVMKSGMKVTFGTIDSTESLQRKIMMMTKILEQVEQSERSYLDLTTDKGYYGEYTYAEMEEMKKAEAGIVDEDEEEDEEETTETKEKDSEKKDKENTEKTEKSEKSEKSEKTEKAEKSEKPKASAKPTEEADPRKKPSADSENENSDKEEEQSESTSSEKSESESKMEESSSDSDAENEE